ncbi:hypothetical protein K1F50_18745 [Muricauda oceani]|uniref:Uncharacterized protein n=1 Tax=Flagellimonas oceani TaxID=2698672 RepID=A0A6G7J018_9FLAO|nr:BfmA/BtgA family mobilization protein [Allomuricauda oceani]MBW8244853.1 hypothetical protein [Allomuricauda oceani]QII43837.1 hypothetical protein GVT53_03815 [Allomuricauda oceani]
MDRGYEKEGFAGFRIKTSVAKRFRRFCKRFGRSQSMTLLAMLDFFEVNELSPTDRLGETVSSLKHQIKRRFNAVIAIIRDIEKNQTKPTTAMLQRLFEEAAEEEREEDYGFGTPQLMDENEELAHYRESYSIILREHGILKGELEQVLERATYIKSTFGNGHVRLDMTKEEFQQFKQRLDHVHHDNPTEIGRELPSKRF